MLCDCFGPVFTLQSLIFSMRKNGAQQHLSKGCWRSVFCRTEGYSGKGAPHHCKNSTKCVSSLKKSNK